MSPGELCENALVNALAARIRAVIEEKGFSARKWCLAAGLSHGTISAFFARVEAETDVDAGTTGMDGDVLAKLADAAGVSRIWLAFGTSEKHSGPAPLPIYARPGESVPPLELREAQSDGAFNLGVAIGRCSDDALGAALAAFYREKQDADAVATVKYFLSELTQKADGAKTERQWLDEIRRHHGALRKTGNPFGGG